MIWNSIVKCLRKLHQINTNVTKPHPLPQTPTIRQKTKRFEVWNHNSAIFGTLGSESNGTGSLQDNTLPAGEQKMIPTKVLYSSQRLYFNILPCANSLPTLKPYNKDCPWFFLLAAKTYPEPVIHSAWFGSKNHWKTMLSFISRGMKTSIKPANHVICWDDRIFQQ